MSKNIFISRAGRGSTDLDVDINQSDLKRACEPVISMALRPIDEALDKANLVEDDIDMVILAGGSSQLPGVYEAIENKLGIQPHVIPTNLMLAVSAGGAYYQKEVANLPKLDQQIKIVGNEIGIATESEGGRDVVILANENQQLPYYSKLYKFRLDKNKTPNIQLKSNQQGKWQSLKEKTVVMDEALDTVNIQVVIDENRLIRLIMTNPQETFGKSYELKAQNRQLDDNQISKRRAELGIGNEKVENEENLELQPFVSIDLGTTTSEVTYLSRGKDSTIVAIDNPDVPENEYSRFCFPSMIYFPDEDIANAQIANNEAFNKAINGSKSVVTNFKIADCDKTVFTLGEQGLTVKDLNGLLLHKIWSTAQNQLNKNKLDTAVITVPAAFNADKCQDTYESAKLAGIKNVKLIDEPTAAFLYYKNTQNIDTSKIKNVMVFDFGGGTTDVAILDVQDEQFGNSGYKVDMYKLLSISGDPKCGGKNVDDNLVEIVKKKFEEQEDDELTPRGLRLLQKQIEKVKVELSEDYDDD